MTDDIVTRLRVTSGPVHPMLEERAEAADEIERLRALVKEMGDAISQLRDELKWSDND